MEPGLKRETVQQRVGDGTRASLRRAYRPDHVADDILGRLIEQIERLPWPRSPDSRAR